MMLRTFAFFLLYILYSNTVFSQASLESTNIKMIEKNVGTEIPRPHTVVIRRTDVFPQSWLGEYSGTLVIIKAQGVVQEIPMSLSIQQTDSMNAVTWNIIYGADKEKGLRPYILRTVDPKKGLYILDEKNSISIENYLIGNKLYSNYAVEGNALICTTEKMGDTINFEIIFGKDAPVSTTGGTKVKEENIPPVKSFPILLSQKAVLTKVK